MYKMGKKNVMKNIKDYILSDFALITRIPIKLNFEYRSDKGNVKYFPLVGIIFGFILLMYAQLFLPLFESFSTAVTATFLLIFLTGGIHLDGLSDSADGLFSYRDKERIIEIMKDSRIGAMGVISVMMIVLSKISFLALLFSHSMVFFAAIFPIYGRLNTVNSCYFGKPLSVSKMGAGFIGNTGKVEFALIHIVYLLYISLITFYFTGTSEDYMLYMLSLVLTDIFLILFTFFSIKNITKKIDGISGDILGAMCEIGETVSFPVFFLGVQICKKLL